MGPKDKIHLSSAAGKVPILLVVETVTFELGDIDIFCCSLYA